MRKKGGGPQTRRYELTATLDRHALEALRLEIRWLARLYGLEIKTLQVETVRPAASRSRS